MDDNLKKELSREKLNRLSSDFEVELFRLIKTLNLISQSKELFKNQVEEIQSISSNLKIKINDFTIKLLEIEKSARGDAGDPRKNFASPGPNTQAPDYDAIIKEATRFREMIDIADKDIENAKTEHLNRLDSFYSVYNIELKASQGELDSKLSHLKEFFAEAPPPRVKEGAVSGQSPRGPEPAHTQGNGSGEPRKTAVPPTRDTPITPPDEISKPHATEIPKRKINLTHDTFPGTATEVLVEEVRKITTPSDEISKPHAAEIPKRRINLTHDTHYPERVSFYSSGKLLMGIVFLFIGALVGITSFYLLDIMGGDETARVAGGETYTEAQITGSEEGRTLTVSDKEPPRDIGGIGTDYGISTVRTAPGSDLYTVVGVGANIRSGPGINHSVATVVLEGDRFESMGERRGIWIKVIAPDGTEGWVSKKVVRQLN